MKKLPLLFTCVLLLTVLGCKNTEKQTENPSNIVATETPKVADNAHNSQNSLDWPGTYQGVLPCASCEGIKTVLTLNGDKTFVKSVQYLGEDDAPSQEKGSFTWSADGMKITLNTEGKQSYKVGEGQLWHLDKSGNTITGDLAEKYKLFIQ